MFLKSYTPECLCVVPSKKSEKFGFFATCACDVNVSHFGKSDYKVHIASKKDKRCVRAPDEQCRGRQSHQQKYILPSVEGSIRLMVPVMVVKT